MILNYTNNKNEYVANYIAEVSGDQILHLSNLIETKEIQTIFSETPYILVADYKMISKFKALYKMGLTRFEGSKIFYFVCVINDADKNFYNAHAFAKDICAVKNMVLFGCDTFELLKNEAPNEYQICMAKQLGGYFRDSVPFDNCANFNYPLRCMK